MLRQLTEADVEFEVLCEPEDISYVGNCSAIDEETDRQAENWIAEQLDAGNLWAWCQVIVKACWEEFEGIATLGGCSYQSEREFCQPGGYYVDLRKEALADLNDRIANVHKLLGTLTP